ncbi:MAG: hypothetical protein ACQUHE_09720 [Bacteroidia bacterium]
MKIIIKYFILILVLFSENISAQEIDKNIFIIYQKVMRFIREPNVKYQVATKTNKYMFDGFDFTNPSGLGVDSNKIWERTEWKGFLTTIDTGGIVDYGLNSNGERWFKSPAKRIKNYTNLEFAPVIISKEGDKAISLLTKYSRVSNSGSSMAFFLEKENGNWKMKYVHTYSFFD